MNQQPMNLVDLIAELSEPAAYPFLVGTVEVRQTHISVVFLAGTRVFKVKKPVSLPFLDFSTHELRKFYCEEEVRLNRRLAPEVYQGVVPIHLTPQGLRIEVGEGPIVEWAVKMSRLPDDAMFAARLERDSLTHDQVEKLAIRIAEFHASARVSPDVSDSMSTRIADCGRFDRIAANVCDNLAAAERQVGRTISRAVCDRLRTATEAALSRLQPLIERRVTEGMIRDLHGDLHLDHVYLFEDRSPPSDLVIVDCIEFNEAFRFIDVVADIAFCTMDFSFHGRRDFARTFGQAYFAATGDSDGPELLPFYTAYRAAVRGKVDSILAGEPEVSPSARQAATVRSTAYWLLSLGELESVDRRPLLVLVSGLPGTGKSTLARGLVESRGFQWIRTDEVRKELAAREGIHVDGTSGEYLSGIYSREWTDRTYAECLRRATDALRQGGRVIVDATFGEEDRRQTFLAAAIELGVHAAWLVCQSPAELVRERLAMRRNDASDADWTIYQRAVAAWQPPGPMSRRVLIAIDSSRSPEAMVDAAIRAITEQ